MKKLLSIIVALVGIGFFFHSCLPPEIEVESVILNMTSNTMKVGEIVSLTATVLPENATYPTVTWESSDPSVATVKDGFVTALKEGTATITATAWGVSTSCIITVASKDVEVTSVTVNVESMELEVGSFGTVTVTVEPSDASDQTITWTSSNPSVVQITTDGTIVAMGEGTASITVSAGGKFTSFPVTVVNGSGGVTVTGVTLDVEQAEIMEGATLQITATVSPEEAAGKPVTWTSSDSSIATVSNGLVTALKPGSVVITATCQGKQATCNIAVTAVPVPVTGVSVTPSTLSLVEGSKATLTATVLPENASEKGVSWSSDDPTIASVDANGQVTGVKPGSAIITVTTVDGNKTATCVVAVVAEAIPVTSVTVEPATLTMEEGESATLTATVEPVDATEQIITWSSSDDSKATVDANGKVTAVKAGTVTITASCGGKQGTCSVTINEKVIPVESVSITPASLVLTVGERESFTATVLPENATEKGVTWSSSDPSIARVNANGRVTAVSEGEATITVTTVDGNKTATGTVTVLAQVIPVSSVTVSPETLLMAPGETATVTASIEPANASDKTVTWSTSDASVATVNDGVVTAVGVGSATITASCGGKEATCAVTVSGDVIPVTGISVEPATLELIEGRSATLSAIVEPANATNKEVTWSSSNTGAATVDANGQVTGVAKGTATITATCGEFTASCAVTVKSFVHVSSVSVTPDSLGVSKGGTATITAKVLPDNATDKAVTWSSSDETIATVDANGKVTGVETGEAQITVTAVDGGIAAVCKVTVGEEIIPVESIVVSPSSVEIVKGETEPVTLTATVSPDNATDKTVEWSSSNTSIATVDANGLVTPRRSGNVQIIASCGGKSSSCSITIISHVSNVYLNHSELTLYERGTSPLTATIIPTDATNKNLIWSSSDTAIARVNENGVVTAVSEGTATITVTTEDGGKTATCVVTVLHRVVPATEITLSSQNLTLTQGGNSTLTATVVPGDTTDEITWSSSNESVATVSGGVVTAVAVGNATITATCGSVSATCAVTVEAPVIHVNSVTLNKTSASLFKGETEQLSATVSPDDATYPAVTWSVDNSDVATVSDSGLVTAKAGGVAVVTATADGKSATCSITVTDSVSGGNEGTSESNWD